MRTQYLAIALIGAVTIAPAIAQQPRDHGAHHPAAAGAEATTQANAEALTEGEIRKVDKEARKLTIRHGPITNLDMPAMTMVFQVEDPGVLDTLKAGDKIRFRAGKTGGAYFASHVESVQ